MKYLPICPNVPTKLKEKQTPKNSIEASAMWQNFKDKAAVRKKLYPRQNGLCVYCEINIELHNKNKNGIGSHIEHILPKEKYPALTFEYSNLVLSCFATGGEIKPDTYDSAPISCGHAASKRSNTFDEALFIKPTEPNCGQYFSYELDGEVIPHPNLNPEDAEKAVYTLNVLNLNCLRLKRLREDTIKKLYETFSELQNDPEALKRFLIDELQENKSFISARQQQFG